jgi:predicted nucleic acid-binding protein
VQHLQLALCVARRETFVEQVLADVAVLPFELIVACVHARLWAEPATKGVTAGAHDLLIAPTALAIGPVVATRDDEVFSAFPARLFPAGNARTLYSDWWCTAPL